MSSEDDAVAFEFPLPDVGEGISEAVLLTWHVAVGDTVEEDDPLCEVETDKAVVEITTPCPGVVTDLAVEPDSNVTVGEVVAVIETERPPANLESPSPTPETDRPVDDDPADSRRPAVAPSEVASEQSGEVAPTERVFAAPSTRRYARERGVDVAAVPGTGPGGRVVRRDVDEWVAGAGTRQGSAVDRGWTPSELAVDGEADRRPLSATRRTIAENMSRSVRTIPHVTSVFEVDAEALVTAKYRLDGTDDSRVTYTPLFLKALVAGLEAVPAFNATLDEERGELIEKRYYHVNVAVHTDEGLFVPVLRDVDKKSVEEIQGELDSLVERANERSLSPADVRGGTFTLTNTGSHGSRSLFGTPIINPPQTGILGLSSIRNEPVAIDDETVEVRKRLFCSLSYDHRIIDGVTAGTFMNHVIDSIEDPSTFLED